MHANILILQGGAEEAHVFQMANTRQGWVGDGREQADSSDSAVSVLWNEEHRVFAVEQFFKNSDSIVTVQRLFRRKFNVERRGAIPD